jgi:hypothetical protein
MSQEDFTRETIVVLQSPEEDYAYVTLRQENDDLLRRLGELQQQMWTLDEKVSKDQ